MSRSKFAQLYVYNIENEVSHRILTWEDDNGSFIHNSEIVHELIDMLGQYNELVKVFRSARDFHR